MLGPKSVQPIKDTNTNKKRNSYTVIHIGPNWVAQLLRENKKCNS